MYSCAPYATASGFVELPYLLFQSAVFMPITYWMIGFEANAAKFFFFWLVFLMALTLNTFLGQLLVMVTPSQQVGQLLGSGGLPFFLLLLFLSSLNKFCLFLFCFFLNARLGQPITPSQQVGLVGVRQGCLSFLCFVTLLLYCTSMLLR